ncbi:EVE domain-containing protein [Alcanivorax quisquiliarum]|uniref:EVE domain-containing protein n=1 Tax=Alcanivorax quisquiliarum TaxID=2933565 RepID=A0ABT0E2Y1_9GAMM|nr:EVE domain-containing protein [Alcanivorax quisquiliarum]MCK0536169.1 EVE domain-containing protein [Alcanivorax quisquiliarum]
MPRWLFKTEPDAYSIDDLKRDGQTPWEGIRNYQARNRLRDEVRKGDKVFIYHSSCKVPAIVGLAQISREAYPDPTQFDPESPYHDPRSPADAPRWLRVDLRYLRHFPHPVPLSAIKADPALSDMELINRSRLSIQKVEPAAARHLLSQLE